MSGRWSIFAVIGLGLVAALCAALFVAAMGSRSDSKDAKEATVTILVASGDMPPMKVIQGGAIIEKQVAPGEKPAGALTDPVQAVGRILSRAIVEGQALTKNDLLEDGEGAKLASSLPEGMRAVAIEVEDTTSMRALLYPGCSVDVLVSLGNRISAAAPGTPRSRTLLQNVRVLGVEQRSLFSEAKAEEEDERSSRSTRSRSLTVTLLVDPQQARQLHGAGGEGVLSLALRNPLDDSLTEDPAPVVEEQPQIVVDASVKEEPEEEKPWQTLIIRKDRAEVRAFGEGRGTELVVGDPSPAEQSLTEVDPELFDPEEN